MFRYLYYSMIRNQVTIKVINTIKGKLNIDMVETKKPKVPHKYMHNESKMIVKDYQVKYQ